MMEPSQDTNTDSIPPSSTKSLTPKQLKEIKSIFTKDQFMSNWILETQLLLAGQPPELREEIITARIVVKIGALQKFFKNKDETIWLVVKDSLKESVNYNLSESSIEALLKGRIIQLLKKKIGGNVSVEINTEEFFEELKNEKLNFLKKNHINSNNWTKILANFNDIWDNKLKSWYVEHLSLVVITDPTVRAMVKKYGHPAVLLATVWRLAFMKTTWLDLDLPEAKEGFHFYRQIVSLFCLAFLWYGVYRYSQNKAVFSRKQVVELSNQYTFTVDKNFDNVFTLLDNLTLREIKKPSKNSIPDKVIYTFYTQEFETAFNEKPPTGFAFIAQQLGLSVKEVKKKSHEQDISEDDIEDEDEDKLVSLKDYYDTVIRKEDIEPLEKEFENCDILFSAEFLKTQNCPVKNFSNLRNIEKLTQHKGLTYAPDIWINGKNFPKVKPTHKLNPTGKLGEQRVLLFPINHNGKTIYIAGRYVPNIHDAAIKKLNSETNPKLTIDTYKWQKQEENAPPRAGKEGKEEDPIFQKN